MTEHTVGTREEWQSARKELLDRERELGRQRQEIAQQRRELPWVPVEKEYRFATDEGEKTLPELFQGRSQLLIYHLMFGADWSGACPGCSSLADELSGVVVHLNHRDVTLICMSRAPLDKLQAYKQRMGWTFPWVSAYGSDFPHDFGFALTRAEIENGVEINFELYEPAKLIEEAPEWLRSHAESVGADMASSIAEGPGWNAFALADGVVYHTYSRTAPDVGPMSFELVDMVPHARGDEYGVRRRDEYE
jgi:predicted dithiol-disulfide oxidoreductase (DUF899 family)